MKKKIEVYREPRVNSDGSPVHETIKTFKNEPEALAFYNDQRNARRYGTMFMCKSSSDGEFSWDDRREEWIPA